jgi:hypothetical protein
MVTTISLFQYGGLNEIGRRTFLTKKALLVLWMEYGLQSSSTAATTTLTNDDKSVCCLPLAYFMDELGSFH